MNRLTVLVLAGVAGLVACTPVGYVKPGVSDAEYERDSLECADIARRQAFRDASLFDTRARARVSTLDDGRRRSFSTFGTFGLSPGELEFRYRRLCMLSRGYELAPLDEGGHGGDASDAPKDGGDQDGGDLDGGDPASGDQGGG